MATNKSYTDLEQSKKLSGILRLETANMHYTKDYDGSWFVGLDAYSSIKLPKYATNNVEDYLLPCWSLAALLNVLPTINDEFEPQLHRSLDKYFCTYEGEEDSSCLWRVADNPVDACYEMIIKLHELKLL